MLCLTFIPPQVPESIVAPLEAAVRQGQRVHTALYAIDPSILFRVATTPERLKRIYTARSTTQERADRSKRVTSLRLALAGSRLTPVVPPKGQTWSGTDVRFGLAVTDDAGRPIFWMCTNASGDLAMVDSRLYRLSGPASAWFRSEGSRLLALKRFGKSPKTSYVPAPWRRASEFEKCWANSTTAAS